MDKLECMRAFKQVVEAGGYAAAAREMGLTRSTVNKHVSFLEKELNTQLLIRSTRMVKPSEIGLAFYDRCLGVLSDYDEAVAAITQMQAKPQGTLRINAPMSFGTMHLSPAVAEFMQLHESLHIELALADRQVDPIEEGFDITIRIAEPQASTSLITREIAPAERLLCASPAYLSKWGVPRHPRELLKHRCLHYGYNNAGSHWQLTGPDGEMSVPIACAMWSNNGEVLRDAAIADGGIVLVPAFMLDREIADGKLVEVLPEFKPRDGVICAIYSRHKHLSAKVQLFVQFIIERMGTAQLSLKSD
ncbi:MAG: LysR family transcriptional regulator [Granulosicoccus sp.]|nr:LysR family transcriptional regulator [Granulosicoccus sp.]